MFAEPEVLQRKTCKMQIVFLYLRPCYLKAELGENLLLNSLNLLLPDQVLDGANLLPHGPSIWIAHMTSDFSRAI